MNDKKKELTDTDEITAKEWKVINLGLEFEPIVKRCKEIYRRNSSLGV